MCSTLNQKKREVRVYITRTCCKERVPLVSTAFAPPSILVRITVTQSPVFFIIGGSPVAVVTMAWERWSKGFDSHWRIQPSIVSLPLLCSRQQPSSALTVKLASLHVDNNSSALLNHHPNPNYYIKYLFLLKNSSLGLLAQQNMLDLFFVILGGLTTAKWFSPQIYSQYTTWVRNYQDK